MVEPIGGTAVLYKGTVRPIGGALPIVGTGAPRGSMLPGEGGGCSAEAVSLSFLHLFQTRCPAVLSCPNLPWVVADALELAVADGRACCLELAVADALELAKNRPPIGATLGFAECLAVVHWHRIPHGVAAGSPWDSVPTGRSALAV